MIILLYMVSVGLLISGVVCWAMRKRALILHILISVIYLCDFAQGIFVVANGNIIHSAVHYSMHFMCMGTDVLLICFIWFYLIRNCIKNRGY